VTGKYSRPIYRSGAYGFGGRDSLICFHGQYTIASPSGRLYAVCCGNEEGGGVIDTFDTGTLYRQNVYYSGLKDPVEAPFAFLDDDDIAFGNRVWNTRTNSVRPLFAGAKPAGSIIAFDPSRYADIFMSTDSGLELYNYTTGQIIKRWPGILHAEDIYFTADGKGIRSAQLQCAVLAF
jgi:hypothetical protein